MRRLLIHFMGITTTLAVLVSALIAYGVYRQHSAAKTFWGDFYGSAEPLPIKWPYSWLLPSRGPMITPMFVPGCDTDYLPLVPVRGDVTTRQATALCGYGTHTLVLPVSFDSNPELEKQFWEGLYETE